jgi:hypothetical protein
VAALSAAVVLLTLVAGGLLTWKWRQAETALAEARREKAVRVQRQVAALRDAAAPRVPDILDELAASRADVLPLLRRLHEEEKEPARRMRLALALLPDEPELLREPLTDWMLHADDPAEVLLARTALLPYRADLAPRLWAKTEDPQTPADVRLRALAALAAHDPDSPRWQKVAPQDVVEDLLPTNLLHRSLWSDALRPVRHTLLAPPTQADLFPLNGGMKWHYQGEGVDGAPAPTIVQVGDIEKVEGQAFLARMDSVRRGNVVETIHVSVTAAGIFQHRAGAMKTSPPLCLLKFPVQVGESWGGPIMIGDIHGQETGRVAGHEEVEVPAGKFQAVVVHTELQMEGGVKNTSIMHYAPGVGIVKEVTFSLQETTLSHLRVFSWDVKVVSVLPQDMTTLALEKFEGGR